jgi:hypothetical protein
MAQENGLANSNLEKFKRQVYLAACWGIGLPDENRPFFGYAAFQKWTFAGGLL